MSTSKIATEPLYHTMQLLKGLEMFLCDTLVPPLGLGPFGPSQLLLANLPGTFGSVHHIQ